MGTENNKPSLLSEDEKAIVVAAIQQAEQKTSGEIRVFVEATCPEKDPLDRAKTIFFNLKMQNTKLRNAVLVYMSIDDKHFSLLGDEGIYEKTGGAHYWEKEVAIAISHFKEGDLAGGLQHVILDIGASLAQYFPYDSATDKNELPDEIVFGDDEPNK